VALPPSCVLAAVLWRCRRPVALPPSCGAAALLRRCPPP